MRFAFEVCSLIGRQSGLFKKNEKFQMRASTTRKLPKNSRHYFDANYVGKNRDKWHNMRRYVAKDTKIDRHPQSRRLDPGLGNGTLPLV